MGVMLTIENQQTGWVTWHYVRVELSSPGILTCEASVTNVSANSPACIVKVELNGDDSEQVEFRFWLQAGKSEVVRLKQATKSGAGTVRAIDIDEE
ncbi:MAG: hypothetical protein M3O61_11315 [Gemmatimonadota bacterium]|nr:hypothetical protein [Gemmatimonadota bacterium]